MAVTLNKANLVLKDANGNIGKIEQLSDRDLAKIKTAVSDVALVVNQSNHTPIEATTTNKGVVQLATPADVVSGASDKVVTAEQLHNSTTGTSALATENLARIDAVVTEAGISIDHTNTNQLKDAVTTLVSSATPATATSTTLGVVKPDNDTITIDSNGVLTATAQMPGVATNATVGVVKPDGSTITVDGDGTLTATAQMPGVATASSVGVVKPDNNTITVGADGTLTATAQMPGVATTSSVGVVQPDGRTITITADGVISAIGSGGKDLVRSVNGVGADENGNVTIPLPFVKTVNSTAPDASGNISISTNGLKRVFYERLTIFWRDDDIEHFVKIGDTFTIKTSSSTLNGKMPAFVYCYFYNGFTKGLIGSVGVKVTLYDYDPSSSSSESDSYSMTLKTNSTPAIIPCSFDYSYMVLTITALPTKNKTIGNSDPSASLYLAVAQ